jgi:hypothetical protein
LIETAIADVLGTPLRVVLRADGGGAANRAKGAAPGSVASVTAGGGDSGDFDELFSYASERIKER